MEYIEPMITEVQEAPNLTWNEIYAEALPNPMFNYPATYKVYYPYKYAQSYTTHEISYIITTLTKSQGSWEKVDMMGKASNTVFVICAYQIDGTTYNTEKIAEKIGICYMYLSEDNVGLGQYWDYGTANSWIWKGTYINATQEQIKEAGLTYNPFTETGQTNFNGSNWFEWLAETGENILINSGLIDILTYDIGGYTIISLLTMLFPIYMGWCIIKFAIP